MPEVPCSVMQIVTPYANGYQKLLPVAIKYKNLLTFFLAIEEINHDPRILPNITLGYHVYDSCSSGMKAVNSILRILSGPGKPVPNYSCTEGGKLAGVIGDENSVTTIQMAQILRLYGYSQISYGATSLILSDRNVYPTFFRTLQNNQANYSVLSKLLKYFGWTWVGIFASDDDMGEEETHVLQNNLLTDGICVPFIIKVNDNLINAYGFDKRNYGSIKSSDAQVIVITGSLSSYAIFMFINYLKLVKYKTFILGPTWALNHFFYFDRFIFNGSLALEFIVENIPKLQGVIENIHPIKYPKDMLLDHIWMYYFHCYSRYPENTDFYMFVFHFNLHNCTEKIRISDIPNVHYNGHTPHMNQAVKAIVKALNNMHFALNTHSKGKNTQISNYKYQLHHYLRQLDVMDKPGVHRFFNDKGETVSGYRIMNWKSFINGSTRIEKVGSYDPWAPSDQQLSMESKLITWKNDQTPNATAHCSFLLLVTGARHWFYLLSCIPVILSGSWKKVKFNHFIPAQHVLENSQLCHGWNLDSKSCFKCPDTEWPNTRRDKCIPKQIEILSIQGDWIAMVLVALSVVFFLKTAVIFRIFTTYQDTAIVKANNQNLSYILLVSIMMSFLCVFLFLGHPSNIICMLRQTCVGVIYSIAMSSILAKTIIVCIAFKVSKPGSTWRKWFGPKLQNSVVLLCSSVQVLICLIWLAISPPYQEVDLHSYQEKIIVQCNEGLVTAFYSILGYMGILAGMSFVLAFMVRTLPDSFNEAKHITFSMLVFCSVWIAMIPAYLSTKGKDMVAVEIFAIITSTTVPHTNGKDEEAFLKVPLVERWPDPRYRISTLPVLQAQNGGSATRLTSSPRWTQGTWSPQSTCNKYVAAKHSISAHPTQSGPQKHFTVEDHRPSALKYKSLLTFFIAIEDLNHNPYILPNITLGYHVYDSCSNEMKAVKSVLQILSGPGKPVPNYSCTEGGKLAGVIGDQTSITTIPIAQILGLYGYSQKFNQLCILVRSGLRYVDSDLVKDFRLDEDLIVIVRFSIIVVLYEK
ncbi:vomeronasal type-2 receptor 26-like [Pelobates fuscus]|uniref:vomeronasal type-2 receptor 26-like n=1 Tax=Pelobates fuscus TaxID=191477 RepID=UPI002FE47DE8